MIEIDWLIKLKKQIPLAIKRRKNINKKFDYNFFFVKDRKWERHPPETEKCREDVEKKSEIK